MNFGFGSDFWRHHGGRRRFKRGMVKWVVLKVLEQGERHGYDFITYFREIGAAPRAGSVYPVLAALEAEGLVQSRDEGGRRNYTITEKGRRVLRDDAPSFRFEDVFEGKEQPVNDEAQGAFERLTAAWTQAKQVAKPETLSQIASVLNKARKDIYTILSDE